MELESRAVILELCSNLTMLLDHFRDTSLLGEHHPHRMEWRDVDIAESLRPDFREPGHLAQPAGGSFDSATVYTLGSFTTTATTLRTAPSASCG